MPPRAAASVLPLELHTSIAELLFKDKGPLYDEQDICRDIASLMLVGNEEFGDIGRALAKLLCPRAGDRRLGGCCRWLRARSLAG
jgi:hypothetical protein